MDRRNFNRAGMVLPLALAWPGLALMHAPVHALSLEDLTSAEAGRGLKLALEKGAVSAVEVLGKLDGFLGNPKVRIPLPPFLEQAAGLMRTLGQGGRLDEIVTSINRAAEAAVPQARDLLVNAVKGISVQDAKNILGGGDNSVTQFFATKTRTPLYGRFLPAVTKATEKVGLVAQYNDVAGKAAGMGLLKPDEANIQQYVTGKALDGLYLMIGEKEKEIRRDPVGTGSAILQKVFGAIK